MIKFALEEIVRRGNSASIKTPTLRWLFSECGSVMQHD